MLTGLLVLMNLAIIVLLVVIVRQGSRHPSPRTEIESLFGIDRDDGHRGTATEDVGVLFKNVFRANPLIPLRDVVLE